MPVYLFWSILSFLAFENIMENQVFQSIVVTGINMGEEDNDIIRARLRAQFLFGTHQISKLSPVGANFVQSFCIFPTGGRGDRPAQMSHDRALEDFCRWLADTHLDYVAIKWDGWSAQPTITHSHSDVTSTSVLTGIPELPILATVESD